MAKIKIAHIVTRMDWGGSPDIVRILCEYADKEKYEVKLVFGQTKHPSEKTNRFFRKFPMQLLNVPHLRRDINIWFDFLALVRLYVLIKKENFDVVHTHTAKAGMLGRIAAKLAGVKVIVHTSHGHNFYGYFGLVMSKLIVVLERWAVGFTNRLVVLTDLEKRDLIAYQVADESKISKIHTAVEFEELGGLSDVDREFKKTQMRIHPGELVVGMVGRLEPIKGVEYCVEAAIQLCNKHKNIRFMLVGSGSLLALLRDKVQAVGLNERISFTGWRDDVRQIMPIFDVLVLPSLNEAVGLVLIEAQALGIPVLATAVGGIPEVVENGKSGILVQPKDVSGFAQAIESLILDKAKREAMGEFAKGYVKDKYDPLDLVEKIESIYEQILASK
ncbi:MAG: glycosyltransferase family 4 protein [PVC group bacterium]|nr:glycosyltransferase family 4 protein [PVC group bacterium]